MASDNKQRAGPPVTFTRQQYDWLNKMFPELTNLVPGDELAYRAGTRRVVEAVRERVRMGS